MTQHSTLSAPSYSRLSALHRCRRFYYHRYVQRLQRQGSATRPLAGKAGHAALDVLYRKGYDAIDDAHRALIAAYGDHVPSDPKLQYLTDTHLMGVVVQYVQRWPEDDVDFQPLRLRPQDVSPAALVSFEGELDDEGYMIMAETPMQVRLASGQVVTVVIDLVVRNSAGELWVVDHKWSTGYLGGGMTNRHVVSHQLRLYVLAVQALLGSCAGAIVNAVYMGEQANNARSNALRFDRYPYDYTEGQLQETLEWAQRTGDWAVSEEAIFGADESMWLQNDQAHCSECDYLPLCEVSPAMRTNRINALYQIGDDR